MREISTHLTVRWEGMEEADGYMVEVRIRAKVDGQWFGPSPSQSIEVDADGDKQTHVGWLERQLKGIEGL